MENNIPSLSLTLVSAGGLCLTTAFACRGSKVHPGVSAVAALTGFIASTAAFNYSLDQKEQLSLPKMMPNSVIFGYTNLLKFIPSVAKVLTIFDRVPFLKIVSSPIPWLNMGVMAGQTFWSAVAYFKNTEINTNLFEEPQPKRPSSPVKPQSSPAKSQEISGPLNRRNVAETKETAAPTQAKTAAPAASASAPRKGEQLLPPASSAASRSADSNSSTPTSSSSSSSTATAKPPQRPARSPSKKKTEEDNVIARTVGAPQSAPSNSATGPSVVQVMDLLLQPPLARDEHVGPSSPPSHVVSASSSAASQTVSQASGEYMQATLAPSTPRTLMQDLNLKLHLRSQTGQNTNTGAALGSRAPASASATHTAVSAPVDRREDEYVSLRRPVPASPVVSASTSAASASLSTASSEYMLASDSLDSSTSSIMSADITATTVSAPTTHSEYAEPTVLAAASASAPSASIEYVDFNSLREETGSASHSAPVGTEVPGPALDI